MRGVSPALPTASSLTNVIHATDKGARFDGSFDNYSAIMRAIDAAIAKSAAAGVTSWAVQLPPGIGKCNTALDLGGTGAANVGFHLRGVPGATLLRGVGQDFVLKKTNTALTSGPLLIEDVWFQNTSTGGCAQIKGFVGLDVNRCNFESAGIDIDIATGVDQTFSANIRNSRFSGQGAATGIGIQTNNHTRIAGCDIVNKSEGIRACGESLSVTGCRLEVNHIAMMLGLDQAGADHQLDRAMVSGNSMEANDIGLYLYEVAASFIGGLGMLGSVGAPSGQSQYAMVVRSIQKSLLAAMSFTGSYSGAAIQLLSTNSTFIDVHATNSYSGRPAWDIRAPVENGVFINCDPLLPGSAVATSLESLATPALMGVDRLNGVLKGKNLRGTNVTVASGASSVNVVFPIQYQSSGTDVSLSQTTGGSLALGTYYYQGTAVNALGESAGIERTITLTGSNTAVNVAFFALTAGGGFKRRVYRGRVSGVYDGYYELALNANTTYKDTGAAFTGTSGPPSNAGQVAESGAEPDANYSITVSPAWDAGGCWISGKSTTGFTINFHTAPGSDSTVDWQMIR